MNNVFENGARFIEIGADGVKPKYNRELISLAANARIVRSLKKSAGVLQCTLHGLDAKTKSLKKKKLSIEEGWI